MVGVPRSKGCRICVQRRVKCDQTRPTCNNCKKGNRPCPGYGQDLKFQDEGARLRRRFANDDGQTVNFDQVSGSSPPDLIHSNNSTSPSESEDRTGDQGEDTKEWDVVGLDMSKSQRRTFLGLLEGKREKYIAVDNITPDTKFDFAFDPDTFPYTVHSFESLVTDDFFGNLSFNTIPDLLYSPGVNQNQLLAVFKNSLFPEGQGNDVPMAMRYHSRWLAHLPPLTGTNNLLDTSVRAVTLVHVGRLNNSEPCISESRPYYGKALRLLNSALMDEKKGMSSETLCATILLSFYEMFASDNNDSWIRHAGGAGALIKMRGPARHRYGFDREIFLAYRYTLIIDAFQADTASFLDEPEWRQLADDIHADITKSGIQRPEIFEIAEKYYKTMLPLPGVCAEAREVWNAYQNGNSRSYEYIGDLIKRTHAAKNDFRATFESLESAVKRAGNAPTFSSSKDPVVTISYTFPNIFIASIYNGYWTCSSVMNLCLLGLESSDVESTNVYRIENREHALNICRSTGFMLTSSFLGPFFLIFGLRMALNVFEDGDPLECDWVLQKLFEIGDRHMSIAKHVPGFKSGMTLQELLTEYRSNRSKRQQETQDYDHGWLSEVSEATSPYYPPDLSDILVADIDI